MLMPGPVPFRCGAMCRGSDKAVWASHARTSCNEEQTFSARRTLSSAGSWMSGTRMVAKPPLVAAATQEFESSCTSFGGGRAAAEVDP